MGFRSRFLFGLAARVALLLLTAFAFVYSLGVEGLGAARIIAAAACLGSVVGLWPVSYTHLTLPTICSV